MSELLPCYATDYTHEHCKYSVNRGWVENVAHGTLTAGQVREAIFNGSVYASFDGAKYYADGISMQAIADELNAKLNACAERTCELNDILSRNGGYKCSECSAIFDGYEDDVSYDIVPNYCPSCGARVIKSVTKSEQYLVQEVGE